MDYLIQNSLVAFIYNPIATSLFEIAFILQSGAYLSVIIVSIGVLQCFFEN